MTCTDAAPVPGLLQPLYRDSRVTCLTCLHAKGYVCAAWPQSGLPSPCIGGIRSLLQHCPAWSAAPVPISDTAPGADWPEVFP